MIMNELTNYSYYTGGQEVLTVIAYPQQFYKDLIIIVTTLIHASLAYLKFFSWCYRIQ